MSIHYVCTGGCNGIADTNGICHESECKNYGKELLACNCTDGEHNGLQQHEHNEEEDYD